MGSVVTLPILLVAVLIALFLLATDPDAGGARDGSHGNRQDPHVGK
jgi:hypothetical protein